MDGVSEYIQTSLEKLKDNVDTDMKSPSRLVNLQSENVEEIDKVVVIGTSTTHQNDKEQCKSSTNSLLQQQHVNSSIQVTLMAFT
jgi:hypothetical protein